MKKESLPYGKRLRRRAFLHVASLAVVPTLFSSVARGSSATLHLYNWDDYISEATLASFQQQTDYQIKLDVFADGEEQFAKLKLGNSGYDITFPSHDSVTRLFKSDLLLPLDHQLIPNLANLAPEHQNPHYDLGNRYSVPYMWGTMGIAYRKSVIDPPTSWRDVLTLAGIAKNGRVSWLSEATSMVSVGLMMTGASANDFSSASLRKVFDELQPAKKKVIKIAEDNGQDLLAAGEVDLAIEWNGDIAQLIAEDDDIGFVIPQEGSIYYVDCVCILADTRHAKAAHDFINHVLNPQVGSELAEYIGYATPNAAAYALTSSAYRNNPVTFPVNPEKLEIVVYPGEDALRNIFRSWEQLLAS